MLVILLSVFTITFDFNLTGYQYQLDEETKVLTVQKGYIHKSVYEEQIPTEEALGVMLAINNAYDLWDLNIHAISLLIVGAFVICYKPDRPRIYFNWFLVFYCLCLTLFVLWDVNEHLKLHEEITNRISEVKD
ncbi:hypothetical protein LF817_09540 [Halobacillus sp. A1]|uniref:hypothetical protein n=1 Tax=Halobacillus sp. A1 TaxID=2880262 RepID=UPI0020A66408|nr:hypothetical protein [Halobacillus sp. A1]MCP3031592.1 hypothetical protein [Halobacillus sp. A1]